MAARTTNGDDDLGSELQAIRSRELNLKRNRGEIACAECRRLKLKCDRKVPCTSCKRRGCDRFCPTAIVPKPRELKRRPQQRPNATPPVEAASRVPPDKEEARVVTVENKLTIMSNRIRDLEDALQLEYSTRRTLERMIYARAPSPSQREKEPLISPENELSVNELSAAQGIEHSSTPENLVLDATHPLLAADLLNIKKGIDQYSASSRALHVNENENGDARTEEPDATSEMMSAFGMLSIRDGEYVRLLGASAAEHTLLLQVSDKEKGSTRVTTAENRLDVSIIDSSHVQSNQSGAFWPFIPTSLTKPDIAIQLAMYLPPFDQAMELVDSYFSTAVWLCSPIARPQVNEEILPLFYHSSSQDRSQLHSLEETISHRPYETAVLFILFACATSVSEERGPEDPKAILYAKLGRLALGMQSVFEDASLVACQAIYLLGAYEGSVRKGLIESSWRLKSMALSLASSAGINRDPERWNLDARTVEKRRLLFWELYLADLWRTMGTGRPSTFRPKVVDVQFPKCSGEYRDEKGEKIISVQEWRYRFARDVLPDLAETLSSAHPIKYSEILALDRRIRDFEMHPLATEPFVWNPNHTDTEFLSLHPLVTVWHRESCLLFIHRNFFARAMIDFPDEPLRSSFAPSVIAAYRSSINELRIVQGHYEVRREAMGRMWPVWARAIACAVILATVASKGPALSFSMVAFHELEASMALFNKVAFNPVVKRCLPSLKKLRDIAYDALFKDSSPEKSSPTQLVDKSNEKSSNPSPNRNRPSPDKASSVIVSANLFQEVLLANFLARDTKEQDTSDGRATAPAKPSTIPSIEISRSSPPTWVNSDLELALQGIANYQASQPIAGPSNDVNVSNSSNFFVPPNTTSNDWTTPPDLISLNTNHVGNPIAVNSNSTSNNVIPGAQPLLGYGHGSGFNMSLDTNTDGEVDWITFMQLSGFTEPGPDMSASTAFDAGVGMDWESFQFS